MSGIANPGRRTVNKKSCPFQNSFLTLHQYNIKLFQAPGKSRQPAIRCRRHSAAL
jgi:hypothetical protein